MSRFASFLEAGQGRVSADVLLRLRRVGSAGTDIAHPAEPSRGHPGPTPASPSTRGILGLGFHSFAGDS